MFSTITYQNTNINGGLTTTTSGTTSFGHVMALMGLFIIPILVFSLFMTVCLWLIFKKANKPGWASIVPFYNTWLMFEIGGKPGWWSLLLYVPIINIVAIVMYVMALIEISKRFGQSEAFAILLFLIPIVGYPMLAFGKSSYNDGTGTTSPNGLTMDQPNNPNPASSFQPTTIQSEPVAPTQYGVQNPINSTVPINNPLEQPSQTQVPQSDVSEPPTYSNPSQVVQPQSNQTDQPLNQNDPNQPFGV